VSVLTPLFLAGLALLLPLVALHLRRRRRRREVSSLIAWRELGAGGVRVRRRASIVLPLLLVLQAVVIVLIVVALADPGSDGGGSSMEAGRPPQVFVLDDSAAMATSDGARDRFAAARAELDRQLAALAAGTPVSVVLAGATPRLLVSDASADDARAQVAGLKAGGREAAGGSDARDPGPARADLASGLALAAGQLHRDGGTVTLLHAADNPAPPVTTDGVAYRAVAIGGEPSDNQSLEQPVARCAPAEGDARASGEGAGGSGGAGANGGAASAAHCTVFTTVRNMGPERVSERLLVQRDGRAIASRDLAIGPRASVELAFDAEAGARLTLALTRRDANPVDDKVAVTVPDPAAPVDVTLVSSQPASAPLARALGSLPGVRAKLVTPAAYTAGGASGGGGSNGAAGASGASGSNGASGKGADLVVLDGVLPGGALPDAPGVLLVDPPRLPGGHVGGALANAELSGEQSADPLLAGVDLSALAIGAGGARDVTLPPSLRALVWAPDGPLLAAGNGGVDGPSHLALLTFDPSASTLPQLPAFPILLANIVSWSQDQPAPGATTAPSAAEAVNAPVVLRATDGGGTAPGKRANWWPWLLAAALLILLAEWSYPRWARRAQARA
jgi:hypothetical protein